MSPARPDAAVAAWRTLGQRTDPLAVDTLQIPGKGRKTAVYRLRGAGCEGSPVIAKLARTERVGAERAIYQDVLPHVPLPTLRFYGVTPDDSSSERMWIFVEDAGDLPYRSAQTDHRALAARWLGRLHATVAQLDRRPRLPARGPDRYRDELRSTSQTIRENSGNPTLTAGDHEVLHAILACLDAIDARWEHITVPCGRFPATVVHGDFAERNLRCRAVDSGTVLMPFDWETAHWGCPAVDLAQVIRADEREPLRGYLESASVVWEHISEDDVRWLANLGSLFRAVMSITSGHYGLIYERWIGRGHEFARDYARWTMTDLREYLPWLDKAAGTLMREDGDLAT